MESLCFVLELGGMDVETDEVGKPPFYFWAAIDHVNPGFGVVRVGEEFEQGLMRPCNEGVEFGDGRVVDRGHVWLDWSSRFAW